jgi:hypothetical protein
MPTSDSGAHITYSNANTRIEGDNSRSVCVLFRANGSNNENILVSIGSSDTTWTMGCNRNFALVISTSIYVHVFGMCEAFDNYNISVGPQTLYDGAFHQLCVTYNKTNSELCVYRDSQMPTCIRRNNGPYNTAISDVRIGWWSDLNRQFTTQGGGIIKSVSLFNSTISQQCVLQQINTNN